MESIKGLQIGNWVLHNNKPRKIRGIFTTDFKGMCIEEVYLDVKEDDEQYQVIIDDIQPIPLTKRILRKNGFERKCIGAYTYDGFPLYISIGEPHIMNDEDLWKPELSLQYVHELQNVISLLKIKQEIKL